MSRDGYEHRSARSALPPSVEGSLTPPAAPDELIFTTPYEVLAPAAPPAHEEPKRKPQAEGAERQDGLESPQLQTDQVTRAVEARPRRRCTSTALSTHPLSTGTNVSSTREKTEN